MLWCLLAICFKMRCGRDESGLRNAGVEWWLHGASLHPNQQAGRLSLTNSIPSILIVNNNNDDDDDDNNCNNNKACLGLKAWIVQNESRDFRNAFFFFLNYYRGRVAYNVILVSGVKQQGHNSTHVQLSSTMIPLPRFLLLYIHLSDLLIS